MDPTIESSPQRPRLVCFDLGGVVVRICRTLGEAITHARLDARLSPNALDSAFRRLMPIYLDYQTGRISTDQFIRRTSDALDGVYTPDEVLRFHRAWTLGEYPQVETLIADLNDAGLTTACLSNTNAEHWSILLQPDHRAIAQMRHRFASHLLGLHKPDAEIYLAFEQALNVTGDAILFFDDSIENVHAADALGWMAIHIDPTGNTAEQMRAALKEHDLL